MPKRRDSDPFVRWADDASNDDVDRDLGNLFRSVRRPEPMSAFHIESTRRRLLRTGSRRSRPSSWSSLAIVLSLLVGGASAALAEWAHPNWWYPHSAVLASREPRVAAANPPRALPSEQPSLPAKVDEPTLDEPPKVDPPPARALARALPSANSNAAARSTLALESQSLERALVALRREHDARSALALLDQYDANFPAGELALEAAAARVDALLLLGRRTEASSQLEKMPLERLGPRADLLLLRAEMRADGDCPRALVDFDRALSGQPMPAVEERALYGRANCRMRTGDDAGADADLRTYLARYPTGRFADQVRARLSPR
jgi:hypothetical protein